MRAVIFLGGDVFDYGYIKRYLKDGDFIIAADSGYRHVKKLGLEADVMIGDMDSVSGEYSAKEIITLNVMKNDTDSEAAAMLAYERGADELVFLAFRGSRADHSLANMLLLKTVCELGISAFAADEHNEVYFLDKELRLFGEAGQTVSILPLCELCGVSCEGLMYALSNETLHFSKTRGISNEMTGNECTISAKSGCALVIKSRD